MTEGAIIAVAIALTIATLWLFIRIAMPYVERMSENRPSRYRLNPETVSVIWADTVLIFNPPTIVDMCQLQETGDE